MLIDKPRCNFKNCRYCFDSNCTSADKYENCKLTDLGHEIAKLTVDLDNAKTEVAMEIFEEIEPIFMSFCTSLEAYTAWKKLKKKYTEGQ